MSDPSTEAAPSTPSAPGRPPPANDESKMPRRKSSLTQRVMSGLGVAKRVVLKSLGEIQLPQEDEAFTERLGAFQLDSAALIELSTRASTYHACQSQVINHQRTFAETLAKLGSHSKSGMGSCVTVQEFVPFNLRLQSQQNIFNKEVKETIVLPVESLLANEVAAVKELLKKYESVRLELGDRNRTFKQRGSDVNAARCAESEVSLKKIKEEVIERIGIVTAKKDSLLQSSLADLIQQQHTYYNESAKICCSKNDHTSFSLPKGDEDDA